MKSSTRTSEVLQTRRRDAILYATLNRPESGNALSLELIASLQDLWQRLESDSSVRAVVLEGAGRFSAPATT